MTERTALANQIRGLIREYGLVIAQGIQRLRRELPEVLTKEMRPELVREVVGELRERWLELDRRITDYDQRIEQLAKQNEAAQRLMQVEGVGPMTATAIVATVGEGHAFTHGRQFAAWLGLVPKQHSGPEHPCSSTGRIEARSPLHVTRHLHYPCTTGGSI